MPGCARGIKRKFVFYRKKSILSSRLVSYSCHNTLKTTHEKKIYMLGETFHFIADLSCKSWTLIQLINISKCVTFLIIMKRGIANKIMLSGSPTIHSQTLNVYGFLH